MADFTKVLLSGGVNGRSIKVVATASPGTAVHAAHATALDELWLWANNSSGTDVKLTIEFGGVTSPDDTVEITIPAESGWIPVVPGLLLTAGLLVKAFAGTTNVLGVNGYVNRIA